MEKSFRRASEDFEGFYLRHYQAIYRVCYAFMKNPQDAEDCTEDTFVRAITSDAEFENERHERAWLTRAAMNICKDRLKHWWNQKVSDIDSAPEILDEKSEADETLREIREQVMELPDKYKEVIWLHYFEGYSTDEIASILARPPSTVRNQLRDARGKLKHLLTFQEDMTDEG